MHTRTFKDINEEGEEFERKEKDDQFERIKYVIGHIAYIYNQIIDVSQFYVLMIVTLMLNISVPISLKLWKPYYLGFKLCRIFNLTLSRPEPAEIKLDMVEHREKMEAERNRYKK